MFERDETMAVALLGALSGINCFLLGPPGTAKSLISRRIACAFNNPEYFEYLMNRFSTPEDVFGPVSIKELKEDNYVRKTEHYLPKAEFAFLDEIWKSSPAILNTLLTLVNEGTFRNGSTLEKVPLKALVAASNETPEPNQGLEALFDRFIIRLFVGPIEYMDNFDLFIGAPPVNETALIPNELQVTTEEWVEWQELINQVELSTETMTIVRMIRQDLPDQPAEVELYISDRRWQRAAMLMKAAAFFNDRQQTNHSDALLLQHCLWTNAKNRVEVADIVSNAVKESGFDSGFNLAELDQEKDELDKEIHKELYHSKDVYKTVSKGSKLYYDFEARDPRDPSEINRHVFVPVTKAKSIKEFHPVNEQLIEISSITGKFDGQGTCLLEYKNNYSNYHNHYHVALDTTTHKLKVLFHKGAKKDDVNERLVNDLHYSVGEMKVNFEQALNKVESRLEKYEEQLLSTFVPLEKTHIALSGITDQIESLKLRIADCDRLEALCQ